MLNVITFSCTGARVGDGLSIAAGDAGLLPPHAEQTTQIVSTEQGNRLIDEKSFPSGCVAFVGVPRTRIGISKCVAVSPSGKRIADKVDLTDAVTC
jgi:hypothetical protein